MLRSGLSLLLILSSYLCEFDLHAEEGAKKTSEESEDNTEEHSSIQIRKSIKNVMDDVLRIPRMGRSILASDGKTIFFEWTESGTRQIWKLDISTGNREQLTRAKEPSELLSVLEQDQEVLFARDKAGAEQYGIYRLNLNNKSVSPIFSKASQRAIFGAVSLDQQSIFYLANDKDPSYFSVYKFNLKKGKRELLLHPKINNLRIIGELKNHNLLLLEYGGPRDFSLFELNVEKKVLNRLLDKKIEPGLGFLKVKVNSHGVIYLLSHHDSDFLGLFHFENGELKPLYQSSQFDLEDFEVADSQEGFILVQNEKGVIQTYQKASKASKLEKPQFQLFSQQDKDSTTTSDRDLFSVRLAGLSNAKGLQLLHIDHPNAGHQLALWDLKAGTIKRLGPSTKKSQNSQLLSRVTTDECKFKGGPPIPLIVREPKVCEEQPCHIVVHYHGGPEIQAQLGFEPLAEIFTRKNFIFIQPNVRGSSGFGRRFREADDREKRLEAIEDLKRVAQCVRDRWVKDKNKQKIGIAGRSYGGYLVQLAMTQFAGQYDAGVSVVGLSHLPSFLEHTAPYRRSGREKEYGALQSDRELLEKISPLSYVELVSDPLLLIHGLNDARVPYTQSTQFVKKAKEHGKMVDLLLLKGEGHRSQKKTGKILEYGSTLEFFLNVFGEKNKDSKPAEEMSIDDEARRPSKKYSTAVDL